MDFMKDMKEETFYVPDMSNINHCRNLVAEERVATLDQGVNYTLAKIYYAFVKYQEFYI